MSRGLGDVYKRQAYMGPSLVANLVVGYAIYVPMQKLTKTPQMANIYKVKSKETAE